MGTVPDQKIARAKGLSPSFCTEYFVYLLKCSDDTYYVGATNNLERRVKQHNHSKSGAHYTKIRRPAHLVHFETFATLAEARAREAEIRRMTRKQKESLF